MCVSCAAVSHINCGVVDSLIESIQPNCRRARHSLPLDPDISRPPLSAISILSLPQPGNYNRQRISPTDRPKSPTTVVQVHTAWTHNGKSDLMIPRLPRTPPTLPPHCPSQWLNRTSLAYPDVLNPMLFRDYAFKHDKKLSVKRSRSFYTAYEPATKKNFAKRL